MKKKLGIFIPVTLGMLTAFGPFLTDFYLPVLPEMTTFFNTSPALASLSLTTGMIGLAAGQVFIGPLTDKYGRNRILVISMIMFAVATILCILAPNIYIFNLMRIFQGVAGSGGIVISKSMATDMFSGKELANFMAILGSINGIAPVCAPVVGGVMAGVTSWQGVFCLLLGIGIILAVCSWRLPETLPADKRIQSNILHVYSNLFRVFRNPRFTLSTLAAMACFFTFFAYIASSPFILQQGYGLSPFEFSLCFALNALMIGVGAGIAPLFKRSTTSIRHGALNMLSASIFLGACLLCHLPLVLLMCCYIYLMFSFGLMQPGLTAVALDAERNNAGAASAIFGASGFVAGAIASPIVALGNINVTSSCVMFAGAVICVALSLPLCKRLKPALQSRS